MIAMVDTGSAIVALLLFVVGAVALGTGLVIRAVMRLDDETFDDEASESWPYLSDRQWFYVLVYGGLALVGLGFLTLQGVA